MNKEFIPYEQALALKKLGYVEQCLALYDLQGKITIEFVNWENAINSKDNYLISAPLYQQAFEFFRENYDLHASFGLYQSRKDDKNFDYEIINHDQTVSIHEDSFKTYEDAQLSCLKKLIELQSISLLMSIIL